MPPIGCRIARRAPELDPSILEPYMTADVSEIGDAMRKARVFQAMDPGIRPFYSPMPRLFGRALTVKMPPGDFLMVHKAVELVREGDVIVVDGHGDVRYSAGGAVMMAIARMKGAAGLVVDGAYRDVKKLREMGVPVFARAVNPIVGTLEGPGEINTPVQCGGVTVEAGDLVVGDEEGLIVVPWRKAEALIPFLKARQEHEQDYWARLEYHAAEFDKRWDEILDRLGCEREE